MSRNFLRTYILPCKNSPIPSDHWANLTPTDIKYLLDQGHTIGAHTANHQCLTQLSPSDAFSR